MLVLIVVFLDREQMVSLVEEEFLQGCPFFTPIGKPGQATDVIGYIEFGQGVAFAEGCFHPLQEYQKIGRQQGFVLVKDFPFGGVAGIEFLQGRSCLAIRNCFEFII